MVNISRTDFQTRLETIIHAEARADFDKIADIMLLVDEMMEDIEERLEDDDTEQDMMDDEEDALDVLLNNAYNQNG